MNSPQKKVKVLVMSVGPQAKNYTVKYLKKIGTPAESICVCLPNQYKENATTYTDCEVFLYDEQKYINDDFDFYGFKKRNCGGVGRQGIAEATELYGDDWICFQVDDDTSAFAVKKLINGKYKSTTIKKWANLEKMIRALNEFWELTGIEMAGSVAAAPPTTESAIQTRKIYNNFIMHKGNRLNFDGFRSLSSDDNRFNLMNNLLELHPMAATPLFNITFHQAQGDRNDGNAVIYNGDYSWKKSFYIRMLIPSAANASISEESNRKLFRENIAQSKIYPDWLLTDDEGKVVGKAKA